MGPNEASQIVIGAVLKVHTELGAGLLESAYDPCVYYEFTRAGLHFEHQVPVPIIYQGIRLAPAFRVDYIVETCLIVELKCVEKLQPVHLAQVLTYLKLTRIKLGLLINFNVPHLRSGIRRVINGQQADL
jgi:GxxExxY protein